MSERMSRSTRWWRLPLGVLLVGAVATSMVLYAPPAGALDGDRPKGHGRAHDDNRAGQVIDRIIAVVNGEVITLGQLQRALSVYETGLARYGEGDYVGQATGINHETVYWYDRHVPILFLGAGVQPGVSDGRVYTVDFAPTLAGLAGIQVPDDLDGRRIY